MTHFSTADPDIIGNPRLRDPQKLAYHEIRKYYSSEYPDRQTIVVLPTGSGKTGLMSIAPYDIVKKKVMIITPQTIVRNTVLEELNPLNPLNFYFTAGVFSSLAHLPTIVEYDKTLSDAVLNQADIVILNVHKLQERLEGSLLKRVDKDFFDMIVIDEAHHSEARTWKQAVEYFENAKVLKVTGTPFRSDGVEIEGKELFRYSLGTAMAKGYVKSLEKFAYAPGKMEFVMKDSEEIYSLEEIKAIKDDEWISRSVALSPESNRSIIAKSIERLERKRRLTDGNPHKIVAVACSQEHAEQINDLYHDAGLRSVVVHSNMEKSDLEKAFRAIETHNTDVVVNVALLGEGYDHRFLSIAAIFRPYRSDLPYQQFIGRVLRSVSIKDGYDISAEDNIAEVVHHRELNLEPLWDKYKKELEICNTIKDVKKQIKLERTLKPTTPIDELDFGLTQESDEYLEDSDVFLDTEFLRAREARAKAEEERIQQLMKDYGLPYDSAKDLSRQIEVSVNPENKRLLRPDLYEKDLRKQLNNKIVEEIIPSILVDFNLSVKGKELSNVKQRFIDRSNFPPYHANDDNGATLGKYFNASLKKYMDKPRGEWDISEYERAIKRTGFIEEYLRSSLSDLLKGE